jgi:hypothetical protein
MLRWKDGEFITPFLIDAERAPGIRTIPISPFALLVNLLLLMMNIETVKQERDAG